MAGHSRSFFRISAMAYLAFAQVFHAYDFPQPTREKNTAKTQRVVGKSTEFWRKTGEKVGLYYLQPLENARNFVHFFFVVVVSFVPSKLITCPPEGSL